MKFEGVDVGILHNIGSTYLKRHFIIASICKDAFLTILDKSYPLLILTMPDFVSHILNYIKGLLEDVKILVTCDKHELE